MTSIGERIRAARLARGWSQPVVAKEVGCSVATYKRYESIAEETPNAGYRYLPRIGALLGLDLTVGPPPAGDPDNPRLSEATELQLVNALTQRIATRAIADSRSGDSADQPIEVRGMDWPTEGEEGGVGPA